MIKNKNCSNCGTAFKCGATEPDGTCWCTMMPHVVPMTEGAECLCPECLNIKIKRIEDAKGEIKHQPVSIVYGRVSGFVSLPVQ